MIQKLRELLAGDPFRPFTVALAAGRRFDIVSPDMIWMPAEGRGGLHVFLPAEDRIVSVNLMLVTSVEHAAPSLGARSLIGPGPADFYVSIEKGITGQEQLAGRELPRRRSVQPDERLPHLPPPHATNPKQREAPSGNPAPEMRGRESGPHLPPG